MKGILAPRSTGIKLLTLFLLSIIGYIFFSGLGIGLASAFYNIDAQSIAEHLTDPSSGKIVRLVQGFASLGIFLFPALMGAYMFSFNAEKFMALDFFPRPGWLIFLILLILAYSAGVITDALYQFSSGFTWPSSLSWLEEYFSQTEELISQQYQSLLHMQSFPDFLQVLVVMALLPAVAEEALFRGVLQPLLTLSAGRHFGIFLTSLAFALLHQQFEVLLAIFVLGLVLGYLREWTKSLWVPTLVHFFNNASIVVMIYYFDLDYANPQQNTALDSPAAAWLLSGIFLICLALIYQLSKKQGPAPAEE